MSILETKEFEKVTVGEICEACNYPRATFYNYFDDSYDLLNYCWIAMMQDIKVDDYPDMVPEERVYIIFNRVYDYFDSYKERLQKIMMFNSLDGALVMSCSLFVKQQINRIMMDCPFANEHTIPHELLAEHFSNTLQLIIEWCFLRRKITSKEEAEICLRYLLENIK
ncbi:MAG: TetR/AcrR family transcriptional regulator [bacterium]|nr:TetR/AcrR family transcriptional regulator [bacterium]